MGLDIYKYKIVDVSMMTLEEKDKYSSFKLEKDETNKNTIAFFETFKHFSIKEEQEYIHWVKTFEAIGLKYGDYEWRSTSNKGYEFVKKGSNYVINIFDDEDEAIKNQILTDPFEYVVINDEMLITYFESVDVIYAEENNYQRKGMDKSFYSDYLSGCWYVAESNINEDDGIFFAFTKELLDKAKNYSYDCDETPITKWELEENEFVFFSY